VVEPDGRPAGLRRAGRRADLEQAEVVVVGGPGRLEERRTRQLSHVGDGSEAQNVVVERDAALDVADEEDGVVESDDGHRRCLSGREYLTISGNLLERSTIPRYPRAVTRWLDEDEQRTWRAFIEASGLLMDQLDRELQRDAGMPHAYYEILVRLSEQPDRSLRMSELAERSQSSRSRVSHAVARLEESGWVRRESVPDDRRAALAVLTDEGFAALAAAAPGHVEGVRRHLLDRLTPTQVVALRRISEAIRDPLIEEGAAR
jgi:DNA-binding MarR family transcriptional regulator